MSELSEAKGGHTHRGGLGGRSAPDHGPEAWTGDALERISAGIRDAAGSSASRRRANAVELLDTLLDRSLKRRLLPLVEDGPRGEKLRAAELALGIRRPTAD